jgi:Rieske Fe-S protein
MRRRDFLDRLLSLSGLGALFAVAYPVFSYVFPPRGERRRSTGAVLAAKVADVPPGSAKIFPLGTKPGIVVHTAAGEWRAFKATCTHLSCTVRYRAESQQLWCPCHDGYYDLHGRNVAGPPPRPLPEHRVSIRGDDIYVSEEGLA